MKRQVDEYPAGRALSTGEAPAIPAAQLDAAAARELVRDDEIIILLLRPSLLFIPLAALGSLMFILIITLALALLAAKVNWVGWSEQQAYALGVVMMTLRLGWQGLEWFNRLYVLTDRRIITRSGVLRLSVYESQLRQIQHTTVFMRVRERVFAMGTIGFATAGSDVFDTYWVMLRQPFVVHRIIVDALHRYGDHRRQ